MAGIHPEQLYANQYLSDFSISYMQADSTCIADKVAVRQRVQKRSGLYFEWSKEQDYRIDSDGYRRPGTRSTEIDVLNATGTFHCKGYAKNVKVTDEERDDAEGVVPIEHIKTKRLSRQILRMRELRVSKMATTAANYAGNTSSAASVSFQWDDYVSNDYANSGTYVAGNTERYSSSNTSGYQSNPFADAVTIMSGIESAIGVIPNRVIIPWKIAVRLREHPEFVNRYKFWSNTTTSLTLPDELFGCKVLVPRAQQNTAKRKQTDVLTLSTLWGNNVIFYYVEEGADDMDTIAPETLCTFKTFSLEKERLVYEWYQKDIRSTIYEQQEYLDEQMPAPLTGWLYTSVLHSA